LTATLDDPDGTFAAEAVAWEALGKAARELAGAIRDASGSERAVCSFCAKHAAEVDKIFAARGAYICSECVALCDEIAADDP
jgi:hypothetical protein